MYTVYANDQLIYDPSEQNPETSILQPKLELKTNDAGSLSFVLPPANSLYNSITKLTTIVKVYRDSTLIFRGRVFSDEMDFYKLKTFACEGDMAFFVDSVQRPFAYTTTTLSTVFTNLITAHNSKVDSYKQFQVGTISQTFQEKTSPVSSTDYSTTSECLSSLVSEFGGIMRTRCELVNGVETYYVDWIEEYTTESNQQIVYGINLNDLTSKQDSEDVFTILVPTGKDIQDSDGNVTGKVNIADVNGGKDYLQNNDMVEQYGKIELMKNWSEIETPSALLTEAQTYMTEHCLGLQETWTMKAIDLSEFVANTDTIELGDKVYVYSEPHGLQQQFTCNQITIDLGEPGNNEYTFGDEVGSLSQRTVISEREIQDQIINTSSSYLKDAKQEASNLINGAMGGYVLKTNSELYIMDTNSLDSATKVWRWNVNGLGYWTGQAGGAQGGTYSTAITIDGQIVADKITTGFMDAQRVKAYNGSDNNQYAQLTYDGLRMYNVVDGVPELVQAFTIPTLIVKNKTSGSVTEQQWSMDFYDWDKYSCFILNVQSCALVGNEGFGRTMATTIVSKAEIEDFMDGHSTDSNWEVYTAWAEFVNTNYSCYACFDITNNKIRYAARVHAVPDVAGIVIYGM